MSIIRRYFDNINIIYKPEFHRLRNVQYLICPTIKIEIKVLIASEIRIRFFFKSKQLGNKIWENNTSSVMKWYMDVVVKLNLSN